MLRFTPYGYRVRAIGSNPEAATFSRHLDPARAGPDARAGRRCSAACAGCSGSRSSSPATRTSAPGFELQAIAAAVIGGTPLRGGSATVVGAVLGLDPAERRQQRARLLRRAGQLELVRHGRGDPHRRRARQPDPRPPPRTAARAWTCDPFIDHGGETVLACVVEMARRAGALGAAPAARSANKSARQRRPRPAAAAGGGEGGQARLRLPDHDDELRAGDGARRARRRPSDTPGVKPDRVRAGRGQRAQAGAALPGRDAHVQGRRGDDDAHARPVHPPAADRRRRRTCRWWPSTSRRRRAPRSAVKLLIGNSNVEIGQDLAKALLPKIPEDAKGEILIGTDTPGLPVLEQRNAGFKEVMQ